VSRAPSIVLTSLIATSAATMACGGSIAPTPAIVRIDTEPAALVASDDARDDLAVRIEFIDGDGDLGGGRVELVDQRSGAGAAPIVLSEAIPPITDARAFIMGTLTVRVRNIDVLTGDEETLRYAVTLVDSSGKRSNTMLTPPVVVRR
jgi:hypothetical protein